MTRQEHESGWTVFCRVIDNHGDLGVCWRLATQLAARGLAVQLFVDEASALDWLAPTGCEGVLVKPWPSDDEVFTPSQVPRVVIEAFGCDIPLAYQAAMAARPTPPIWINLEYFSLEASAQRNHGLPSPVLSGPGKGLTKWFYYPGWGEHSGGLLTDVQPENILVLTQTQHLDHAAKHTIEKTQVDCAQFGIHRELHISVFCYEPAGLPHLLAQLARLPRKVQLHITAGRATAAVKQAIHSMDVSSLDLDFLDYMSQSAYDDFLTRMDLNLVRGEDSLVRAMCAGKPLLWQIYPQHDGAHIPKLQAFLQQTGAPPLVVQAHLAWNASQPTEMPELTPNCLAEWSAWAAHLRATLASQTGLTERLIGFVSAKG